MGEFCSFPPITLNPKPWSVFGNSTTRGWACPSAAANAATVAFAVALVLAWNGNQFIMSLTKDIKIIHKPFFAEQLHNLKKALILIKKRTWKITE